MREEIDSSGTQGRKIVESDFTAAQVHLRSARLCLQGRDKVSEEATEALDLLIVAVTTAEIVRDQRNVVWFPDVATRHPQPS
ncbi:hypothetical protein [Mesorhizobium koreense]|jgi:hypothetical protein|uniref:hypothetical protein n=1 Tax=Mesorhizobium koreense TaxID=3074855 RepID=UPI00287BC4B3|nr:hypothetical protein [Mesorhizobium sp. WR6]